MHNRIHRSLSVFCLLFIVACTQAEPTPTPSLPPTETAVPTHTSSPIPTLTPTATPTLTPTPGPLTPAQIFDLISPAIAFIETPIGSGSGVLFNDSYLLTNAHVVWPFESVRIVFSDGTEETAVPVVNIDLMTDLAIIGPIETDKTPQPLTDGENLIVGSDVYLIGYPGEVDDFPQPTITRGLISRMREWEAYNITYFQSDATIAGGQSGGVLVSEGGDVIGLSGFYFSEAEFALVASTGDLIERVAQMMDGKDVAGLGPWQLPLDNVGRRADHVILDDFWEHKTYLVNEPPGTKLQVTLEGDTDGILSVYDPLGFTPIFANNGYAGQEFGTGTLQIEAPHFVIVKHDTFGGGFLRIESNYDLIPYQERIDGRTIKNGDSVEALLDFPGDYDYFRIFLTKNEVINIQVDSILIDPYIRILPDRPFNEEEIISDDDSGGGIFGLNAELTFKAPEAGRFHIIVSDAYGTAYGGYILTVGSEYAGAPTPVALPPTPVPITTDFGNMREFTDPASGLTLQVPLDWQDPIANSVFRDVCLDVTVCFNNNDLGFIVILIEDVAGIGLGTLTLDDYVDLFIANLNDTIYKINSIEPFETTSGHEGVIVDAHIQDGLLETKRFIILEDNLAYNVTFILYGETAEPLLPMVEYVFRSVDVK